MEDQTQIVGAGEGQTEAEKKELQELIAKLQADEGLQREWLNRFGSLRVGKHHAARMLRGKAKVAKRKAKRKKKA